jgi:hypothetical protein
MAASEKSLAAQLQRLRREQRARQPWPRPVFVTLSAVVDKYGLDASFLEMIDEFAAHPPGPPAGDRSARGKEPLEQPLFALAAPEKYGLIMAIMDRVGNPYLAHAFSPAEILACRPLYERNPAIAPEKLARYHLVALLWEEMARAEAENV